MQLCEYIDHIGVKRLALELDVTADTVRKWKSKKATPKLKTSIKLIEKSMGLVKISDILTHFEDVNHGQ